MHPIILGLVLLGGSPQAEIGWPLPDSYSESVSAECGLINATIEYRNKNNAKKPEYLRGKVSYGSQRRSLAAELDPIAGQLSYVGGVGIACDSERSLIILVNGGKSAGQTVDGKPISQPTKWELFVNDRLEVTVRESN